MISPFDVLARRGPRPDQRNLGAGQAGKRRVLNLSHRFLQTGDRAVVFFNILPVGIHQRGVDQVLGDKPDLGLVGANHIAHQQVVRAVVALVSGKPGHFAGLDQQDFVCLQQSRDLHGHFLATLGKPGNLALSATSAAIATLTPPNIMIRSAIWSTNSLCSPKCLSNSFPNITGAHSDASRQTALD